jgi:hypothetical protein
MVVRKRRNPPGAAPTGAHVNGARRDETPATSTNAREVASLYQAPDRRTRDAKGTPCLFNGDHCSCHVPIVSQSSHRLNRLVRTDRDPPHTRPCRPEVRAEAVACQPESLGPKGGGPPTRRAPRDGSGGQPPSRSRARAGEPSFRQLEPDLPVAESRTGSSLRGVSRLSLPRSRSGNRAMAAQRLNQPIRRHREPLLAVLRHYTETVRGQQASLWTCG